MHPAEKQDQLTDSILEIAAKHFAEKGFSGARVDEIAADAGVNKATMYYRIGNKQALYETIFISPLENTRDEVGEAVARESSPEQALRVYIKTLADSMTGKYSYIPAVMMRELVSGAERIPQQAMLAMCDVQQLLRDIIERGKASGAFRDVNPFMVHMLIMGSLTVYTTGEPMRQRMINMFVDHEITKEHINNKEFMLDEIVNMIIHSVLKNGKDK